MTDSLIPRCSVPGQLPSFQTTSLLSFRLQIAKICGFGWVEALFVSVCQHSRLVDQKILLLSSDMHGTCQRKWFLYHFNKQAAQDVFICECLLLIRYRFRNTEMVATYISNVRSWAEEKVVHWENEDIWLQVFRPEICINVVFTYSFTIHLSTCSQDWAAFICVLQRVSVLVLPSLPACYGTVNKHSFVCFVLMLCTLHP